MIIIVTGTPCTGKTTLAKKLAQDLKFKYVDVTKLLKQSNICEEFDKKNECLVVDVKELNKFLLKLVQEKKDLVIDSHLSHYLPQKYVDLCIVCKCDLSILKKRLTKRGYSESKVRDNLDAEIFDVCLTEAMEENGHKVFIVDTSKGYNIKEVVTYIKNETKFSST